MLLQEAGKLADNQGSNHGRRASPTSKRQDPKDAGSSQPLQHQFLHGTCRCQFITGLAQAFEQ